jgi:D-3-phosphoglycerate dehydrogenase
MKRSAASPGGSGWHGGAGYDSGFIVVANQEAQGHMEKTCEMTDARKIVAKFNFWQDPAMAERLAREADIDFVACDIAAPDEQSWAQLSKAHVYHISSTKDELPRQWFANRALLERCPQLLCVSATGAGYDTVDVPACTAAGVLVVNQSGANAAAVAEHTLGLMLDISKKLSQSDRLLRRERGFAREDLMGREIGGKVLGLVGLGHVGRRVAALAKAFGMTVLATDPYLDDLEIARRGALSVPLDELLSTADFVSVHCPRDKDTVHLMNAETFSRMKPGAVFLNTARGGIHDEAALHDALRRGHLAGAGLDVWDIEPPPLDHPLLALESVVATYHTAGVTTEARRCMASIGAEQIIGTLRGDMPPRLINPEAWPAYSRRFQAVMGHPVTAEFTHA